MKLTSKAFGEGHPIPSQFTCDGDNINPPLTIIDVPPNTKSLTLIVDDPDAPAGDWVHWLVWNIDPKTETIEKNSLPLGSIVGTNDFGNTNYGGPCPPSGTHRYQFKLYALDTKLDLPPSTNKSTLLATMIGHVLEESMLTGTYSKM